MIKMNRTRNTRRILSQQQHHRVRSIWFTETFTCFGRKRPSSEGARRLRKCFTVIKVNCSPILLPYRMPSIKTWMIINGVHLSFPEKWTKLTHDAEVVNAYSLLVRSRAYFVSETVQRMKIAISYVVTPYCLTELYQVFEATYPSSSG
jgi:hypothetical protein